VTAAATGSPRLNPEIAVVIPTRGRETRLAFALEALAAQTVACERFEVVVVRDGDAEPPLAGAPPGLRLRELTRPGVAGPTAKRNLGWRATEAPLVAFTDDDCRPQPDWVGAMIGAAPGERGFLQGRTEPDPDELYLLPGLSRTQEVSKPTGWFEACNVAYPRALLERLGGFDEAFGFGGEDTDLAYRAIESGASPRFVDGARVWHAVIPRGLRGALRDATRWNDLAAVLARHPGLRRALHHRVFWLPSHERWLLALGGVALANVARRRRARALGLAAILPYLDLHLNWRQPGLRRTPLQLAVLAGWALADGAEIAARLPAAVRRGVFVL
jgi:GT2 family glycosyltransferase